MSTIGIVTWKPNFQMKVRLPRWSASFRIRVDLLDVLVIIELLENFHE